MYLEIALTLVAGALLYHFFFRKKEESLLMGDGWWGPGQRPGGEEDESIRPFKIETTDEELNDLFQRIDQTRYTEPLEGSRFNYGFNTTYLRKVVSYWRNNFNWKKQLDILNQYPHFKTKIEGLDVHFIHVKPTNLPAGRRAKPILMVHGWPGAFYEFYKIIPFLTDPGSHNLSEEHIFEVICPSIPGYGFSEASHKQGCDSVAVARIFYKLMQRLGFRQFYAQGGDWGSIICTNLSQIAPSSVKGLHLNMVPASGPKTQTPMLLSILFGQRFPGLFGFQEEDVKRLFPFLSKVFYHLVKESGYMHLQATKPDTAGTRAPVLRRGHLHIQTSEIPQHGDLVDAKKIAVDLRKRLYPTRSPSRVIFKSKNVTDSILSLMVVGNWFNDPIISVNLVSSINLRYSRSPSCTAGMMYCCS